MQAKITGTVVHILPKETKSNYSSRKIWIKTGGEYPQTIEVVCGGKKADLFDRLMVNDAIEADVNIQGREYNGKVYNSLNAWKINA